MGKYGGVGGYVGEWGSVGEGGRYVGELGSMGEWVGMWVSGEVWGSGEVCG